MRNDTGNQSQMSLNWLIAAVIISYIYLGDYIIVYIYIYVCMLRYFCTILRYAIILLLATIWNIRFLYVSIENNMKTNYLLVFVFEKRFENVICLVFLSKRYVNIVFFVVMFVCFCCKRYGNVCVSLLSLLKAVFDQHNVSVVFIL